jgi:hypothetical protein
MRPSLLTMRLLPAPIRLGGNAEKTCFPRPRQQLPSEDSRFGCIQLAMRALTLVKDVASRFEELVYQTGSLNRFSTYRREAQLGMETDPFDLAFDRLTKQADENSFNSINDLPCFVSLELSEREPARCICLAQPAQGTPKQKTPQGLLFVFSFLSPPITPLAPTPMARARPSPTR